MKRNKLFTVGPVEMDEDILAMGSEAIPYFRTEEFSEIMLNIVTKFKKIVNAPKNARFAILTASGTGAMEAAVSNVFKKDDKVLVINGGSFGQRFSLLCERFDIPYSEIKLQFGEKLTSNILDAYDDQGYTALLINVHETSVGQLYDMNMIKQFCQKNNLLLVADVISTLLADPFDMSNDGVDVVIASSQKAMALPPGLSFIVTSERATNRIMENKVKSMYFDLKDAFNNMNRGQTPFTPAVGIILQLDRKLDQILEQGIENVIEEHAKRAKYFRQLCNENGIAVVDFPKSNALTTILFPKENAYQVFLELKDKYGLMLTPSGGALANKVLRVGHLGNLKLEDYDLVIKRIKEVM